MKQGGIKRAISALALALAVGACDSPTGIEVHADGVAILAPSGEEVARYTLSGGASGRLDVTVGQTTTFRVRGIDDEGELFVIDGSEYSIRNPHILLAHLAAVTLEGSDQLAVRGIEATPQTTLQFQLYHGGHEEFFADGIRVRVQ